MFILLIVSMSYVITIVEFTQWPLVLMVVFLRVAVMIKLSAYGMLIRVNVAKSCMIVESTRWPSVLIRSIASLRVAVMVKQYACGIRTRELVSERYKDMEVESTRWPFTLMETCLPVAVKIEWFACGTFAKKHTGR